MFKSIALQDATISRDQLREQIRKSVEDAQIAAEKAAKAATEGGGTVRTQDGVIIQLPPVPPRPGEAVTMVPPWQKDLPPRVESIFIALFVMIAAIIIGYPIMRAIAKRIEHGTPVAGPIPKEVGDRLEHISQSVDAIAVEVERISEAQRFTTRMLSEKNREGTTIMPGVPRE